MRSGIRPPAATSPLAFVDGLRQLKTAGSGCSLARNWRAVRSHAASHDEARPSPSTDRPSAASSRPVKRPLGGTTAFYAGLRRGELMALDWENIDLSAGTINVTRSYDPKSRCFVSPKSRSGTRRVPIAAVLREHLISHRLRIGRSSGLVFGPDGAQVFSYSAMRDRAARARSATCVCGIHVDQHDDAPCDSFQPLQRIGLHEALTPSPPS